MLLAGDDKALLAQDAGAPAGSTQRVPTVPAVPWLTQLVALQRKNAMLQLRRPAQTATALLAPAVAVLLAYAFDVVAGGSPDAATFPPTTACGTLDPVYMNSLSGNDMYNQPIALNNGLWRAGAGTMIVALGPVTLAIIVVVQLVQEASSRMLGVLRTLGASEAMYWISWLIHFGLLALANSLLAAGIAKAAPVHVFQSSYFGAIFLSLLTLQLALVSLSFLLAALAGAHRKAVALLSLFLLASTIGLLVGLGANFTSTYSPGTPATSGGGMWQFASTTLTVDTGNNSLCQVPVVSGQYDSGSSGGPTQRGEFFDGCYVLGSGYDYWWGGNGAQTFGLAVFFLTPSFHFGQMWAIMLGATSLPGQEFTSGMAGLSPAAAATRSIPGLTESAVAAAQAASADALFPAYSSLSQAWLPWQQTNGGSDSGFNCPADGLFNVTLCVNQVRYNGCPLQHTAPAEGPSFGASAGYLLLLSVAYVLLAAWVAQAFPGGNGVAQRWYFPFQPSYWRPSSPAEAGAGAGTEAMSASQRMARRESFREGTVVLSGVTKTYAECEALKGVSLELEAGEVVALLGHNGAGKSTLVSILTASIAPTAGNVLVFGRDAATDVAGVRRRIGVCRQDDFLYENLTPREHMELWATLRGVPQDEVGAVVAQALGDVDLLGAQHRRAGKLSGGMQRRLSVVLATVGYCPLIVLDEQSTGMDPVNRRLVWRHIERIKPGRTIVMTTHAMEEADQLADRVVVLHKGEVVAAGTPLELKAEHGTALQFSLLVDPETTDVSGTVAHVQALFAGHAVTVESSEAGNVSVALATLDGEAVRERLAAFVAWLDGGDSGVREYGFSNSSLEEVYLKITGALEADPNASESAGKSGDALEGVRTCCPWCCSSCLRCCLGGCCRCCCCPKAADPATLEAVAQQAKKKAEAAEEAVVAVDGDTVAAVLKQLAALEPRLAVRPQARALVLKKLRRQWTGRTSVAAWIFVAFLAVLMLALGLAIDYNDDDMTMPIVVTVLLSLLLPFLVQPTVSERELGLWHLMRSQGLRGGAHVLAEAAYAFLVQFALDLVILSLLFATPYARPTVCEPGDYSYTSTCASGPTVSAADFETPASAELAALGVPGSYGQLLGVALVFALALPGTVLALAPLFRRANLAASALSIYALGVGVGLPVALLFVKGTSSGCEAVVAECQAVLANQPAPDEDSQLTSQWAECFLLGYSQPSNFCLPEAAALFPQFAVPLLVSLWLSSDVAFASDPPTYAATFVQQLADDTDVSCSVSGASCHSLLVRARFNVFLGYAVLGALLLLLLGLALTVVLLFPTPAMERSRNRFAASWARLRHPRKSRSRSRGKGVMEKGRGVEDVDVGEERAVVDALVRPFLERSAGAGAGVREGEGDPAGIEGKRAAAPKGEGEGAPGELELEKGRADVKADVKAAQAAQAAQAAPAPAEEGWGPVVDAEALQGAALLPAMLAHRLRKVYAGEGGLGDKVAVASLDVHVAYGECLGLLGSNGAGKSTTMKMLAAAEPASAGVALVGGKDVSCEKLQVFSSLGNCSQHDVVWLDLTVRRHLEFFARLKGMPGGKVAWAAKAIADAVGLTGPAFVRKAGQLSGGMRRRLSIAIALLASPKHLLLDEPSTGLDPSTRNKIWDLISSFRSKERAIVITTHMMVEADTLCSRIAIMTHGRLRVIGSQQRLKDRFGSGYMLQLSLDESSDAARAAAVQYVVETIHDEAALVVTHGKSIKVQLPPKKLDLNACFAALYDVRAKEQGHIAQFLLSQSSLEDVFINVTEQYSH